MTVYRPASAVLSWQIVAARLMAPLRKSLFKMIEAQPYLKRLSSGLVLHGREIARRTGLPAGTLTREPRRLAGVGLLTQEKRGNQTLYRANRASPVFTELAGILRKTSGLADVVAEALAPLSDDINVYSAPSLAGLNPPEAT